MLLINGSTEKNVVNKNEMSEVKKGSDRYQFDFPNGQFRRNEIDWECSFLIWMKYQKIKIEHNQVAWNATCYV